MTEERLAAIEDQLERLQRDMDSVLALLRATPPTNGINPMHKKGYTREPTEFDDLEMGVRLHNALVMNGVRTMAEFIRVIDTGRIWHLQNIGKVSVQEAIQLRNGLR